MLANFINYLFQIIFYLKLLFKRVFQLYAYVFRQIVLIRPDIIKLGKVIHIMIAIGYALLSGNIILPDKWLVFYY